MPATATTTKESRTRPEEPLQEAAAGNGSGSTHDPSGKRLALRASSVMAIVLLAYVTFVFATPAEKVPQRYTGPYSTELFPEKYQVNLSGSGMKRFLQIVLNVIYEAYEESYMIQRSKDPLYEPYLQSTVLAICSAKTVDEVQGRANNDALMEELRQELDPVLFPVHVGQTRFALDLDPKSGLRPGLSSARSSFRGPFHQHWLHLDPVQRTIRLDDGPFVAFEGSEDDLLVTGAEGETLYLDVTGLTSGFSGSVKVGVHGRIRDILPKYFLVQ